jgi:hypothetical protein
VTGDVELSITSRARSVVMPNRDALPKIAYSRWSMFVQQVENESHITHLVIIHHTIT